MMRGGRGRHAPGAAGAADAKAKGPEEVRTPEGERFNLSQKTTDALAGQIDAADSGPHTEELQCSVCHHPCFKCPVQTPCQHIFHRDCIEQYVQARQQRKHGKGGRSCPICRSRLPDPLEDAPLAIRGMLNKTKVNCPQGCGKEVPFEQLHKHVHDEDGCPFTPLVCGNGTCGASYLRRDAPAHRRTCGHAIVPCGSCGEKLRRASLQAHEKKTTCPYCQKQGIPGCCLDAHMHKECTGAMPVHHHMRMMQELRQLQHQMQSLQHVLGHTGTQFRDVALPKSLRDLLAVDGARYELRVDGIDTPFVLHREDGRLFTDCSAYRGAQPVCLSIAGHSTPPQEGTTEEELQQEGEPPVLVVASLERPQCAGRYTKLKDRVNGKAVWGCGNNRILMHSSTHWHLVTNPAGASNSGYHSYLALYNQGGVQGSLYPPQHPLHTYNPNSAAPNSSITAEFSPPQVDKDQGLCPFAAAAGATEVRVITLP
eukprot:TRINITY_DN22639_c0_g1_i1.p1 TRINITY_DN22639_c0_g1~~TRINITY_DN22639_c0_g1_i1.p1  ORF type:complete len:482 (+),score=117.16 TRINITY_DN22639_c0_g1_i1:86-1531(+)